MTDFHDLVRRLYGPYGAVTALDDLSPSPDGRTIAATGTLRASLEAEPYRRVCLVDVATGAVEPVTAGPHDDLHPAWSPDGTTIAFVSDRAHRGRPALYLLEAGRLGEAWAAPDVGGAIEWLSWSPDGRHLLLGVAGEGAEKAGVEGSGRIASEESGEPWRPRVLTADTTTAWRRAWLYDAMTRTVRRLSPEGLNVWEAAWCGPSAVAAVVADDPGEDSWYDARLALLDVATGAARTVYEAPDRRQLGWPAGSPDGRRLAVVRARCSDRWVVAGDLVLVDPATGASRDVATGADVTGLAWRDDERLVFAAARGLDTVVGEVDAATGDVDEWWSGPAGGQLEVRPALLPDGGVVAEVSAWDRTPEIVRLGKGEDVTLATLPTTAPTDLGREERVRWTAPDGVEVEGLLYLPGEGTAPYATVLDVHGGPVGRVHSSAPSRARFVALLLARGYAVLRPNVRGSSGRGQPYADAVFGDLGGGETTDHLAGLDALVARGVADPARLGVMGGSHGGFMACWLVTQAPERFAAAVAISPVTDWRSQHFTSNIAHFDTLFVGGDPYESGGIRDERSPLLYAGRVRTPTLLTAGDVDRCTPPGQALEFHQALALRGVPTECAIYPGEGHGVRHFPAALDWYDRIGAWFDRFLR